MVPSDYRLDHVVARLIERLEGQRPTYLGRPDEAPLAFEKAARAHVSAALAEFREVGLSDDPDTQARLLEEHVFETFLPRYAELARRRNADERGGYGLGRLAEPIGRLGLVVGTALFAWLVLLKLIALPLIWPLVLVTLSVPFWPDLARVVYHRRYVAQLQEIVEDMGRIQEQHEAYLTPARLAGSKEPVGVRPQPRKESE